jgi:hypothetical protein
LLEAARIHRLTGLLARAVAEGSVVVTQEERHLVFDAAAQGARQSVVIEAQLAGAMERFAVRGLTPVVLKGCVVAHLDHVASADREFVDADLLVPGAQLAAVIEALGESGYRRNLPERRPGFDARFGKDITMQRGDDVEFDLHIRPAFGAFGQRVPLEYLFEHLEPIAVAGVPMLALDAPGRLVHACYNAVLADVNPKIVASRDVALMIVSGRVSLEELRARARIWGGEAVVVGAIRRVWRELGLPVEGAIPTWAVPCRPSRRERLLLRTYPSQGGAFAVCLFAGVAGVRGSRDKVRYLHAFVRPSREYRRARREAHRVSEYREGLHQAASWLRRRRG